MVRDLEFDISELSLITFLQAKEAGKPLVLLPAVMMSRFQHPYIVCRSESDLRPEQLSGRRLESWRRLRAEIERESHRSVARLAAEERAARRRRHAQFRLGRRRA